MILDLRHAALFALTTLALLGSPGPGIAALIVVGKEKGFVGGLPFYFGLQVGLDIVGAACAGGLFSVIQTVPFLTSAMTVIAIVYLLWLAYCIATAPVGMMDERKATATALTARGGFLLSLTNPKAYLAFISLLAFRAIAPANPQVDVTIKWLICVFIMLAVDLAWLWVGAAVGKVRFQPATERAVNLTLGATIVATALFSFA